MRVILRNFRVVDEETDIEGTVVVEDSFIAGVFPGKPPEIGEAAMIIDGSSFSLSNELPVLMPAFVDLHAHFRDPGHPKMLASLTSEMALPSEVLESASLAAAAGGFGAVVCMANTKPVIDKLEKLISLKECSDSLRVIDLYPVMSLTMGMEGKELSEISALPAKPAEWGENSVSWEGPLMLSEDGRDLADDALFLAAMKEAKRIDIPISCHCDFGGSEAEAAKKAGQPRSVWSRIEENNAVRRVIELGLEAGCHIHIAHVSTKEAVAAIAQAKAGGFTLTCEATPHNLCLTEEVAVKLGGETWGRVNPPLRPEEDRKALIQALADGTIDTIATDHAPHSRKDKEAGVPGFSGFETAFPAVYTELVKGGVIGLKRLSSLMSASPSRLLGLGGERGRILQGQKADLVMVDTEASWIVHPETFKTRGKNSAFTGRTLYGKILMTIHGGRVVFL